MSLSDISIKNPVFAWMLMIAMMLFGFLAYRQMGVSQLPDVDMPMINVSVTWTGASPEVVESDVVDVIESALMGRKPTHFQWAKKAPVQHIKSEMILKIHMAINSLM